MSPGNRDFRGSIKAVSTSKGLLLLLFGSSGFYVGYVLKSSCGPTGKPLDRPGGFPYHTRYIR